MPIRLIIALVRSVHDLNRLLAANSQPTAIRIVAEAADATFEAFQPGENLQAAHFPKRHHTITPTGSNHATIRTECNRTNPVSMPTKQNPFRVT